jgi:hypothetical protein
MLALSYKELPLSPFNRGKEGRFDQGSQLEERSSGF